MSVDDDDDDDDDDGISEYSLLFTCGEATQVNG